MSKQYKKSCFVIMPFSEEFQNQWDMAFKPAIQDVGLIPFRGDEEDSGTNVIMRDVTRFINDALIIIADLTGRNPNVMYELGLSHAAKKKVIMLIQEDEEVPFDVKHIRYLRYSPKQLNQLKIDLIKRIKSTLEQDRDHIVDLFPEIKILTKEIYEELTYLREKSISFKINAEPPSSDIFFNDRYVGTGNVSVSINKHSKRNTISLAALEHYEYHKEITDEDINQGKITIKLDPRENKNGNSIDRVSQWLRLRKKDPNNPVLMRAIIQFLLEIKAFEEAEEEAKELIEIAPQWYMARNVVASVYHDQEKFIEAIKQYELAISFRPDHAVGYLGLACAFSRTGEFKKAIKQLKLVQQNKKLLNSYSQFGNWRIKNDPDFKPLKQNPSYKKKFLKITNSIENKITRPSS